MPVPNLLSRKNGVKECNFCKKLLFMTIIVYSTNNQNSVRNVQIII